MVSTERIKNLLDKLYKLNYWFCNEMMKEEESLKKFEKACEEVRETEGLVMVVSAAPGNVKCMKGCMEDTVKIIRYLKNKENHEYIEPWQMAGVEAMFNQCSEDNIVPFDLPGAIMAALGMWNELEEAFKK